MAAAEGRFVSVWRRAAELVAAGLLSVLRCAGRLLPKAAAVRVLAEVSEYYTFGPPEALRGVECR